MLKVVYAEALEKMLARRVRAAMENCSRSFKADYPENIIEADLANALLALCLKAQRYQQTLFWCHVSNMDERHLCYFLANDESELISLAKEWVEDQSDEHRDPWRLKS